MIRIRHYGGAIWGIEAQPFSQATYTESKATPGMRWDGGRRAWVGYIDAVDAAARRIMAKGIRILDIHLIPDPDKPIGATLALMALTDLRDYQKEGVAFLVSHSGEGAFLADEVGLGKTIQGLRAARALRGRTVIVVPNFLKSVWLTGIEGDKTLDPPTPPGWPGQKVLVLKGTTTVAPTDPGAKVSKTARDSLALAAQLKAPSTIDIVIINYDILYAWVDVLLAWEPKTLIFDEAHMLMGDKARRTRAAERLRSAIPNRMMLSATPMTSRPRDLWAPVNVLSEGRFGAPFPYFKKHCAAFQERVSADRIVWNCNPPEAPIWMGDCSFRPLGTIRVGDKIMGWRKGRNGGQAQLVATRVLQVHKRRAAMVRITLASGRVIRCTADHQWLTGAVGAKRMQFFEPVASIAETHRPPGSILAHFIAAPTPMPDHLRETASWLRGFYDGEGTASGGQIQLAQSFKCNPDVCVEVERVLRALSIPFSIYKVKGKQARIYSIRGGRQGIVNFLAHINPIRREPIEKLVRGGAVQKKPDRIVKLEHDGRGPVVSLTTATGNYVAWGYGSKNCKGSSDLPELHRRLKFFMLRRTKEDVGMQLPPRTRQIIEVEVERRFQLSMAVALQNDESMRRALDMAADGKLGDVAQLALGHAQDGNKVVVGTWRKTVAEELANALIGAGIDARVITGDVSEKRRKEILTAQPPVICATLDSMGMGLDLSFANVGICAELHYVPSKLVQWEGRLHRFRQKRPTLFQYVIASGTADELIRDMVIKKMHTFKDGVGKSSDKLMDDLEGAKKSPVEVLRGLYERMRSKQKANPNAEIEGV